MRKRILLVDDDSFFISYVRTVLEDFGEYAVVATTEPCKALELASGVALILVDLRMKPCTRLSERTDAAGGHLTGLVVAREIREKFPHVPIILWSAADSYEISLIRITLKNVRCVLKPNSHDTMLNLVFRAIYPELVLPKSFIVCGKQDRVTALELKNYLQNELNFAEPTILADEPGRGQTNIEKFEAYSGDTDWVFILLTPDEVGGLAGGAMKARAAQTVLFQLGYFYGMMRRRSGQIILLQKGDIEVASDLLGMLPIDITQGIQSAGDRIRQLVVAPKGRA